MNKYKFALEEARRGADQQLTALTTARANTMTLLTVAGAATTFLTGLVARTEPTWTPWLTLAAVLFVALVGLALTNLWPRRVWTSMDPYELIAWVDVDKATEERQERNLAIHMAVNYEENADVLTVLTTRYCLAVACLVGVIAAFTVELMI